MFEIFEKKHREQLRHALSDRKLKERLYAALLLRTKLEFCVFFANNQILELGHNLTNREDIVQMG